MEILFSEESIKQINRFKRINKNDVENFLKFLLEDENFKKSWRQAMRENSKTDPFEISLYDPEFDVSIFASTIPAENKMTVTKVKRGNHMKF